MNVSTVASGRAAIHARESGHGTPLVCLHAGVADSRLFDAQHDGLADTFRVISYDRRGFGQTTTPDEPFSHVGDLRQIYDAFALESAVLMGCSQGGRIAIDFALRYPDRVQALILIAPAVSGAPDPVLPPDLQALEDALDAADAAGDLDEVNRIEAHMWLDGPREQEGRVSGQARDLFLDMNGIALRHAPLLRESPPPDAWSRLGQLAVPTLTMSGTLDYPHIVERCQTIAAATGGSGTIALPDVAHLAPLEVPGRVSGETREFFARIRATGD